MVTLAECYSKLVSLRDSLIKDYQESPTVIDLCKTNFKLAAEAFKSAEKKHSCTLEMAIVPNHYPLRAVKDIKLYSDHDHIITWSVFMNPSKAHNFQETIESSIGVAYYKALCAFHKAIRDVNNPSVRVARNLVAETVRAYTNLAARPECGVTTYNGALCFKDDDIFSPMTIYQSILGLNSEIALLESHPNPLVSSSVAPKRARLANLQAQFAAAEDARKQQNEIFMEYSGVQRLCELEKQFREALIARDRLAVAQHLKELNEFDETSVSQSIVRLSSEIDRLKDHPNPRVKSSVIQKRAQLANLHAQLAAAKNARKQQNGI